MKTCLSLLFATVAAFAAVPSLAFEPDPSAPTAPVRLTFADSWTLRLSDASDNPVTEPDMVGAARNSPARTEGPGSVGTR
jgi:hypothetical protein